jgi:orotate phosphoribosyltransferase
LVKWFKNVLHPDRREQTIQLAAEVLKDHDFDTIAVSGVSGLLLGPILAYMLDKNLIVVRKDGDSSHSNYLIEGTCGRKYVIIDDFMSTGATVSYIRQKIDKKIDVSGWKPECVGFYNYDHSEFSHRHQRQRCEEAGIPYLNPGDL